MDELGGRRMRWFLVSIVLMGIFVERGEGQLVENFYKSTCPKLEQIVRQAVRNTVLSNYHYNSCYSPSLLPRLFC
ncbi:hypothetical protein IC582_004400 [Cucumis melo]